MNGLLFMTMLLATEWRDITEEEADKVWRHIGGMEIAHTPSGMLRQISEALTKVRWEAENGV